MMILELHKIKSSSWFPCKIIWSRREALS